MSIYTARNHFIGLKVDACRAACAKELRLSMTEAEALFLQDLRANRTDIWHFRCQQVITGFIVDFYCNAAGLVVELDGVRGAV
jgi:very-short-patch-repair endonuclease